MQLKEILMIVFLAGILNTSGTARTILNSDSNIVTPQISPLKVKSAGGKNYLQWTITHQDSEGIFIIERSVNGKDYEVIGIKKCLETNIPNPVLYCFIDEEPLEERYYRVTLKDEKNRTLLSGPQIIDKQMDNEFSHLPEKVLMP